MAAPPASMARRAAPFLLGAVLLIQGAGGARATVYTWAGGSSGDWTSALNWSPVRTTPQVSDVLVFANSATVTLVPSQTIAQLGVGGGATVQLTTTSTGSAVTLNITGAAVKPDLGIGAGSTLEVKSLDAIAIQLGASATGEIDGTLRVSGAPHRLRSGALNALVVKSHGQVAQAGGFTGNLFGTTAPFDAVTFASGSLFVQGAGGDPFGAAAPNAVTAFRAGSLYRIDAVLNPSLSGRTYANFEYNAPGFASAGGAGALVLDDLTVTQGHIDLDMSGACTVRGNVSVLPGATLGLVPATGTPFVTLGGAVAQRVAVAGTLAMGALAALEIDNSAGVTLDDDLVLHGRGMTFTAGLLHTGTHALVDSSGATPAGAGPSTGWVDGNLEIALPVTAGATPRVTLPVGDHLAYTPVDLRAHGAGGPGFDLEARVDSGQGTFIAQSGIDSTRDLARTWTIGHRGLDPSAQYDATFLFLPGDVKPGADPLQFIDRVWRSEDQTFSRFLTDTLTATSTQVVGATAFGQWELGDPDLTGVPAGPPAPELALSGVTPLQWAGAGHGGAAPGVYFLRVAALGRVLVRRVVLER